MGPFAPERRGEGVLQRPHHGIPVPLAPCGSGARGVKIGVATSVRRSLWDKAEVYPAQQNRELVLTEEQRDMLALFE